MFMRFRIYGTNISFTSTGRISMHEPNLQTVAKDFDMEFLGNFYLTGILSFLF